MITDAGLRALVRRHYPDCNRTHLFDTPATTPAATADLCTDASCQAPGIGGTPAVAAGAADPRSTTSRAKGERPD